MTADWTLQREVEDLYARYAELIDDKRLQDWTGLFDEDCLYRVISKENHDRGLPLSQILCESPGMLRDRVLAFEKLNVYGPRTWRHMISQIRVEEEGGLLRARANFVVFETRIDRRTEILCSGRYLDALVRTEAGLRFREKVCVYDTTLIPGSIVSPL
jgi:3-phenylpropionate/cinnamic acid dioxygenase small subunit